MPDEPKGDSSYKDEPPKAKPKETKNKSTDYDDDKSIDEAPLSVKTTQDDSSSSTATTEEESDPASTSDD